MNFTKCALVLLRRWLGVFFSMLVIMWGSPFVITNMWISPLYRIKDISKAKGNVQMLQSRSWSQEQVFFQRCSASQSVPSSPSSKWPSPHKSSSLIQPNVWGPCTPRTRSFSLRVTGRSYCSQNSSRSILGHFITSIRALAGAGASWASSWFTVFTVSGPCKSSARPSKLTYTLDPDEVPTAAAQRFTIVAISAFEFKAPASKSFAFSGCSSSTPSNPVSYGKDISRGQNGRIVTKSWQSPQPMSINEDESDVYVLFSQHLPNMDLGMSNCDLHTCASK